MFKVSWNEIEDNSIGSSYPEKRAITVGTTLVIDWKTNEILARLTTAPSKLHKEIRKQRRTDRDNFLKLLVEDELLKIGNQALDSDGEPLLSAVQVDVNENVMNIRGTGKFLHIVEEVKKE